MSMILMQTWRIWTTQETLLSKLTTWMQRTQEMSTLLRIHSPRTDTLRKCLLAVHARRILEPKIAISTVLCFRPLVCCRSRICFAVLNDVHVFIYFREVSIPAFE